MINRVRRITDRAYFAKHQDQIEINITNSSYENALSVEELKEDVVSYAIKSIIDDIVKIKQNFPQEFTSTVEASVDIVVMDGKDFRELQKLLDGLHEIGLQKERKRQEEKID